METYEIKKIVSEFVQRKGLSDAELENCFGREWKSCSIEECPNFDLCEECSKFIDERSLARVESPNSSASVQNESVTELVNVQNIQRTKI